MSLRLVTAAVLTIGLGVAQPLRAQIEFDNNFKFNSGQDIQPIFEGWSHAPGGGFAMHFGYLNRNHAQELSIPVGAGNSIEPGGPDRGQPTFFYNRTNRNVFTVMVAKDWGKKELIWTLTANGKTQKAIGWLQSEWEIDPAGGAGTGGRVNPEAAKNKPPVITIEPASPITTARPLALTARVTDDGVPKPAPARTTKPAIGQETPPLLKGGVSDAPVNVPQLASPDGGGRGGRGAAVGLTVSWMVWRGPANVSFTSRNPELKEGQAQTTVTFTRPGEYVLRARASDRLLTTVQDVKVTVSAGRPSP